MVSYFQVIDRLLTSYQQSLAMPPRTQKLLDAFRAWCDEERGRRAEIARLLGTKRQSITDWFGGRQQPTARSRFLSFRSF